MKYAVRVYDGQGKLKKVITDYKFTGDQEYFGTTSKKRVMQRCKVCGTDVKGVTCQGACRKEYDRLLRAHRKMTWLLAESDMEGEEDYV